MIHITEEEYAELLAAKAFLEALITAGVDNWEGYSDARRML